MSAPTHTPPPGATAVLVLADGSVFWGRGAGARGEVVGEVCFNTSITGYQEIMTDPSYAGQIISFTFPHIGNVGTNDEDIENTSPVALGCILRQDITEPSNYRATGHYNDWLAKYNRVAICGIDTRQLTKRIRDEGAPTGVICHNPDGIFDIPALIARAQEWPGLEGMDLAIENSCTTGYEWEETLWSIKGGYGKIGNARHHVVAIDYGIKRNILRNLAALECKVSVVPAQTSAEDILAMNPDGVFLSNGPGDPAATGVYAVPTIKKLIASGKPVFGICLGHQMMALALGATTRKMTVGHRGANHPVKDVTTGVVEITSQNHGFVVDKDSLPANVEATHFSLFDGSLAGLRLRDKPVFAVQYHPEASPGPHDSHYLFKRFVDLIDAAKA
ncbi:glutamine-hydrolyzing carbamoyl-phosphate synthase small subunit [Thalassospira sp.]|uniref:glutamine-hydrolyzing carbamoyl-phosphate synthase small subunit n=1 Tax=Thalassospira sp. TaxID=1912094 RepID=UPI0027329E32|nr:glutamine-hydrolyzing carbamoyl-phosphate synthase small subunit [Thalassospira sp.]MDP2697160.1 glutamine-hydrolyzing carbamoyl-phosphate synthase small subunit [Thalassospira sp.]